MLILNDIDYKIIIKNSRFDSNKPDLRLINAIDKQINHSRILTVNYKSVYHYTYKIVKAFDELYPNKEVPEELKKYFLKGKPESILMYILDKLSEKSQKPEQWVYDGLFDILKVKYSKSSEYQEITRLTGLDLQDRSDISDNIAEIIEWYLIDHDFNDLDPRCFDYLTFNHSIYTCFIQLAKQNIKNFNTPNFKKFFETPIKNLGEIPFKVFIANIFVDKFKHKENYKIYDLLNKIGVLDMYLKHTIDKNMDKPLREKWFSFGGTEENMPEIYKKRERDEREGINHAFESFKYHFYNNKYIKTI
jgi:hypothetical protein